MIKGGIFQKTEWYLLNLFTHGNLDEKLLFKLVEPFLNHFLAKNKQNCANCVPETEYQFPKFGDVQKPKLGKECQMKNKSYKDKAALFETEKISCVPTNVKRRVLRSVLPNLALTLPCPTTVLGRIQEFGRNFQRIQGISKALKDFII